MTRVTYDLGEEIGTDHGDNMNDLDRKVLALIVGVLLCCGIGGVSCAYVEERNHPERATPQACSSFCGGASLPVANYAKDDHCACGTQQWTEVHQSTPTVVYTVPIGGGR